MLKTIVNNPFRILGVYSNAKRKEITANADRQKAFLRVHKEVSFLSDLSWKIGVPQRSTNAIDDSLAKINLSNDKITHALFWFINISPLDKAALSNLEAGDENKAKEIWNKKNSFSSSLNLAILALANNDLDTYIANVTGLIHDDNQREEFVRCICDDTFHISEGDLAHQMIDALLVEVATSELYDKFVSYGTSANDNAYLKEKAVAEPISIINDRISKAKSVPNDDADASFNAGVALINSTERSLSRIKEIAGDDDATYGRIADNLAQTILQCGINYYNNSDDTDNVEKALYIQRKALEIAVGTVTQDRCKQNVSILEEKKKISKVKDEIDAIGNELQAFRKKVPNITNAGTLLTKCNPHLLNISSVLGSTNDLYLKISSTVANNALGMLISVVNDAQSTSNATYLRSTVNSAMSLMDKIGQLAMTEEERKHFTDNKNTLKNIQEQLLSNLLLPVGTPTDGGTSPTSNPSKRKQKQTPVSPPTDDGTSPGPGKDTNWGCIIAIVIFVIYLIIEL